MQNEFSSAFNATMAQMAIRPWWVAYPATTDLDNYARAPDYMTPALQYYNSVTSASGRPLGVEVPDFGVPGVVSATSGQILAQAEAGRQARAARPLVAPIDMTPFQLPAMPPVGGVGRATTASGGILKSPWLIGALVVGLGVLAYRRWKGSATAATGGKA